MAIRSCVQAVCPQPAQDAVGDFLAYFGGRLRALSDLARTRTVQPLRQFVDRERVHLDGAWALALERHDHVTLPSLQESVWFLDSGVSTARRFSARCVEAARRIRDDATAPPAPKALLRACVARDALAHQVEDAEAEMHGLIDKAMSCRRRMAPGRAIPFEDQAFTVGAAALLDAASQAKWLSELAH